MTRGKEAPRGKKEGEKGRDPPNTEIHAIRVVITTISGGGEYASTKRGWKRKAGDVLKVQEQTNVSPMPMIVFGDRDMRHEPPKHDEPMVISVVVAEYKVERVLNGQGSSANIIYWSMYMKLGLRPTEMEPCAGKLYDFVRENSDSKLPNIPQRGRGLGCDTRYPSSTSLFVIRRNISNMI
ncbi:hypothetical protein CR513_46965, partial [Mucuna pruriens]